MAETINGTTEQGGELDPIAELLSKYSGEGEEGGSQQSSNTSEQTDGNAERTNVEYSEPIKRKRGRPKSNPEEIRTPKETQIFDFVSVDDDSKPVRENARSRKAKRAVTVQNGLRILAEVNKASKPDILKPIWEISDEELKPVADSITDIIPDLPKKALDIFDKYSAYINIVALTSVVIVGRVIAERQIVEQIKAHYANGNNQTDGTIRGDFQSGKNSPNSNNVNGTNGENQNESFNYGFGNIFANAGKI